METKQLAGFRYRPSRVGYPGRGQNIVEATQNYFGFKLTGKYTGLIEKKTICEARRAINDEIDLNDFVEKEKQDNLKK
nr:hypothetical protein Iba_chr10cCG11150 [Ipomoea batatas]